MTTETDAEPLAIVERWLVRAEASGLRRNPGAMALATADEAGRPAVRMVLLRGLRPVPGYAVFYTNYRSRKARELDRTGRAAAVLYFEEQGQQVRLEGPVLRSPADESDLYFATRPYLSQINAWVSEQSEPLGDPLELERRAAAKAAELGSALAGPASAAGVPRPPHWGGYRLWCDAVELWTEGGGRFHTRLRYERALTADGPAGFAATPWRVERLQP